MEHLSLSNPWVRERPSATEYVQSTGLSGCPQLFKTSKQVTVGLRFYYEQTGLIRAGWVGGVVEKTVAGWAGC